MVKYAHIIGAMPLVIPRRWRGEEALARTPAADGTGTPAAVEQGVNIRTSWLLWNVVVRLLGWEEEKGSRGHNKKQFKTHILSICEVCPSYNG